MAFANFELALRNVKVKLYRTPIFQTDVHMKYFFSKSSVSLGATCIATMTQLTSSFLKNENLFPKVNEKASLTKNKLAKG